MDDTQVFNKEEVFDDQNEGDYSLLQSISCKEENPLSMFTN